MIILYSTLKQKKLLDEYQTYIRDYVTFIYLYNYIQKTYNKILNLDFGYKNASD